MFKYFAPMRLNLLLPRLFYDCVSVDVRQQAKAEPLAAAGVREAVHGDGVLAGAVVLAHPGGQLVVGDGAPELGLRVHHRLQVGEVVRGRERRGEGGQVSHGLALWTGRY